MGTDITEKKKNSSDNKGGQSPAEEREKRKRIPEETVDLPQKKNKLGKIYYIVRKKNRYIYSLNSYSKKLFFLL